MHGLVDSCLDFLISLISDPRGAMGRSHRRGENSSLSQRMVWVIWSAFAGCGSKRHAPDKVSSIRVLFMTSPDCAEFF
jgi:hypothetical protein